MDEQDIHYPRLGTYTNRGNDRGRNKLWEAAWLLVHEIFFIKWWFPRRLRPVVLRAFGAEIGTGLVMRHRVRVTRPWKLKIGNDCWVGEDSWLLTAGHLVIGSDVCLSQGVFVCPGDHDFSTTDFAARLSLITIEDGCWLAAQSFILKDVTIGKGSIIGGRAVVRKSVPPGSVVGLNAVH